MRRLVATLAPEFREAGRIARYLTPGALRHTAEAAATATFFVGLFAFVLGFTG